MSILSHVEIASAGLVDFRPLSREISARYLAPDFAGAVKFVAEVGKIADQLDHHPRIQLDVGQVQIWTRSHDQDGITARDIDLARRIEDIAQQLNLQSQPETLRELEVGLDTHRGTELAPQWAAILTGNQADHDDDAVIDPTGQIPPLWFQEAAATDAPAQRFHFDIYVPVDILDDRINSAVAAGARIVDDSRSPAWVVLSDSDDNRFCFCTAIPSSSLDKPADH